MATRKQVLARTRNWFKFTLLGISLAPSKFPAWVITERERDLLNIIGIARKDLIDNFNASSIELGLNVRDRCWCGKEGKYIGIDAITGEATPRCKEHKDED